MNKLEITFSARVPYDSNDAHLQRNTNIEFDLDVENNPGEIVRQFNKFLALNDLEIRVQEWA
jgi:hypothetical protein